jgi:hypothetical protein
MRSISAATNETSIRAKIAYVIEQHLELENEDVAKKLPALIAAGFDGKRIG